MIRIRASQLETLRVNPESYGRLIASGGLITGGGSHGMFACVVDVARLVHLGELTIKEAIRELHNKFARFQINAENKARQSHLVEQLVKYLHNYEKHGFEFIDGTRRIQWSITNQVMLTGLTPWVVHNSKGYYSYFMVEHSFEWQSQLRFPLYQQFIVDNTIACEVDEIQIGVYSADNNMFDFRCFSTKELTMAVDEMGTIFTSLYKAYERGKK